MAVEKRVLFAAHTVAWRAWLCSEAVGSPRPEVGWHVTASAVCHRISHVALPASATLSRRLLDSRLETRGFTTPRKVEIIKRAQHPDFCLQRSSAGFDKLIVCASAVMPPQLDSDETSAAPPDGGYGWVCVASLFLVNFSTWGAVAVSANIVLRKSKSVADD